MINEMDYIALSEYPSEDDAPRLLSLCHEGLEYLFHILYIHIDSPRERRAGNPFEAPHAHDVYHLLVYTEGRNRLSLNGELLECAPGAIVAVSPGEPHCLTPRDVGAVRYYEITFTLSHGRERLRLPLRSLLSRYFGVQIQKGRFPFQLTKSQTGGFRAIIEGISAGLKTGGHTRLADGSRLVMELFGFLLNTAYMDAAARDESASGLSAARDVIERRFMERLRLDDLASAANLSRDHFCRAFGRRYGVSPISYQIELRLQAAKVLLRGGALGCKEIAGRVGFQDEFYFSRIFKRRVGMPPTDYRKTGGSSAKETGGRVQNRPDD